MTETRGTPPQKIKFGSQPNSEKWSINMTANLMTKKIEMTKNEAKAAGKIGTEKFEELQSYMAKYPGFEVLIKAPAKRKVEFRGLTYEYMRAYIKKHDDEDGTIMAEFNALIALDKKNKVEGAEHLEAASYIDVKRWFLGKFPEIQKHKDDHAEKIQQILAAA